MWPLVALQSKSAEDKGDSQGTPRKKIVEGFHSWNKFVFERISNHLEFRYMVMNRLRCQVLLSQLEQITINFLHGIVSGELYLHAQSVVYQERFSRNSES